MLPRFPAEWGLAALGLLLGTLGRYAMRIQDKLPITWRELIADVMLMGINALLTLWAIDKIGATGKGAVLVGVLFALGQDRIIRVARRAWERRAAKLLEAVGLGDDGSDTDEETPEPVPPSPPKVPDTSSGRTGAALRRAYRKGSNAKVPDDMIAALRKLEGED